MSRCLIYGLIDPRTRLIRYVGMSSSGLKRPSAHRRASQLVRRTRCVSWIKSLLAEGLDYEIVVLEEVASKTALVATEIWWIAYGRASGWPLTNLTDGGEGRIGHRASEDTRRKMSEAQRGRKHTAESKAKIAAAHTGMRHSDEAKAKNASAHKGRTASASTRAKMSAARRGKKLTPEHKAKLLATARTPEAVAKNAATRRGAKRTPESRARMSAAALRYQRERKLRVSAP